MANIKSAKKRILVNKRQKDENRLVKSALNTEIKGFKKLLSDGKVEEAKAKINTLESDINSACSKGVIHNNNASRKISRLHIALNKAEAKSAKVEAPAKVEEVKVEEVKVEAPAKKVATKKTTTKKTADTEVKAEKKPATKKTTKKAETTEEKPAKKTTTKKATKKDAE